MASRLVVFALEATRALGERIAAALGVDLAAHEERSFEDGEHKIRALISVRDADVYVIASLHAGPDQGVNEKLCRLLFFLGSLRDASAGRLTVVAPYLCYARKERKSRPRDPVTSRYVAALLEAVGADRVVALDVHDLAAFQNAARNRTEHLEARKLFAAHLAPGLRGQPVTVVSPDAGGVKRAQRFREALAQALGAPVEIAFMEKQRAGGVVRGEAFAGEVGGRAAVIVDDLISTGATLVRAAHACRGRGAASVRAVATHGLFVGDAPRILQDPALDQVIVTDSVPPFRLPAELVGGRVAVLGTAELLAEAIRRVHEGGSIVDLVEL